MFYRYEFEICRTQFAYLQLSYFKGKGKGRFMELFNTAAVQPILFLHATSYRIHLQRRHASYR